MNFREFWIIETGHSVIVEFKKPSDLEWNPKNNKVTHVIEYSALKSFSYVNQWNDEIFGNKEISQEDQLFLTKISKSKKPKKK